MPVVITSTPELSNSLTIFSVIPTPSFAAFSPFTITKLIFFDFIIVSAIKHYAPVIIFGKGCWFALNEMAKTGATGLGIDWSCSARNARYLSGGNITLQGNYDPAKLLSPISKIKSDVHQMISEFGKESYIVNLGHGILPNIPVSHAKAFVDAVKEYQI